MVGVGQNHLGSGVPELIRRDRFDICQRSHRHKSRRFNLAVRRVKNSCPRLRMAAMRLAFKGKSH